MKYSELIEFRPIEDVIQLKSADDAQKSREYVRSYVMSDRMAKILRAAVVDQLKLDAVESKGILVVGNYGTGKSHLMSVLAAVANDADNLPLLNNRNFADVDATIAGTHIILAAQDLGLGSTWVGRIDTDKLFEALDSFIGKYNDLNFILLNYDPDDSIEKVPESSVIYAEADNKYCKIRTYDKVYVCKKTLSLFEKDLRSNFFFRSHRSYLVNFRYIRSYSKNSIVFENNEKAELAGAKYISFQIVFR